jgi:PIN domain nuclease of toxin-antitoxin system
VTSLLLDTCAAIWLAEEATLSKAAEDALAIAAKHREFVYISAISSWEIGLLVSKGRLRLSVPPHVWFERMLANPQIQLIDLSVRTLIASSFLPGAPPRDPADRIILATAREGGYRLVTRDKHLLAYADDGHVIALAC